MGESKKKSKKNLNLTRRKFMALSSTAIAAPFVMKMTGTVPHVEAAEKKEPSMRDNTRFTGVELVGRFEDVRDIRNLMGKYVTSIMIKSEKTMFKDFWSEKSDICMGVNEGYYKGREAIEEFYKKIDAYTAATRDVLMDLFPKQTKGKTREKLYGIGPRDVKNVINPVVEIANDGKTAKGMWACYGHMTNVTSRGPVSHWVFGTYAGDFIREGNKWKIWHLLYLEDINSPTGHSWSEGKNPYPELPEFAPLGKVALPEPNVKKVVRERYHANRPFTKLPRIPEPYDSFDKTFSYGI